MISTQLATNMLPEASSNAIPAPVPVLVDSLPGLSFFPAFNVITENNHVMFSLKSIQAVDVLKINGEVKILTGNKHWRETLPLLQGNNVFNLPIEIEGAYLEKTIIVRHIGVIGHMQDAPSLPQDSQLFVGD